jgi:hypothetical protein
MSSVGETLFGLAMVTGFAALILGLRQKRTLAWKTAAVAALIFVIALGFELSLRMPE